MKIRVERDVFADAATWVVKSLPARPPVPVLGGVMLEATDAVISVWGRDRVGMHLAPRADSHSMGDSNLAATFGYVADQLNARGIATARGGQWYAATVRNALARAD